MKPKKLKIMGLNSFVEEQEIDFSLLTEKGFFGIFGPTGSGKSTILDAITIALYGEISRSTKNRLEFINSFRSDMNIVYEFEMGSTSNRKLYSIERHYKRKKDGGISCDRAILKEVKGEDFEILSEGSNSVTENIVSIVGLKCDDFTRSVVLPQGKFSDFLKLTKSDRGKMLERILNLEEFGSKMAFKIKAEVNMKKSELDIIYGALSRYEGLTEEAYEEKKENLKLLLLEEETLRKEKEELQIAYEKYSLIWELQKELSVFEARQREIVIDEVSINDKRDTLIKAKFALNVKPFLDNVNDVKNKIYGSEEKLKELRKNYEKASETLKVTEEEYANAYNKKDKLLPLLIDKEAKVGEAIKLDEEIIKLENDINQMRKEYQILRGEAAKVEEELGKIHKEKDEALKTIENIDNNILKNNITEEYREKIAEALDVEKEFSESKEKLTELDYKVKELGAHLVKKRIELEKVTSEKDKEEQELIQLNAKKKALIENSPGNLEIVFKKQEKLQEMSNILNDAVKDTALKEKLQEEIIVIEGQKNLLSVELKKTIENLADQRLRIEDIKNKITEFERRNVAGAVAEYIEPGKPCPVCGSAHHPKIAEKYQQTDVEDRRRELSGLEKELSELMQLESQYRAEAAGYDKELKIKNEDIEEVKKRLGDIDVKLFSEEKQIFEIELRQLKVKIEKHTAETKQVDNRISELVSIKNKIEVRFTEISTEVNKDNNIFELLKDDEAKFKESHEFIFKKYEDARKALKVSSIQEEYLRIKKCSLEEEEDRKLQQSLRQRIYELDDVRNKIELSKTDVYNKMEMVRVSGQERNKIMNDFITKRNEYSENKNPYEYLSAVRKEMTMIKEHETTLKARFETERNAQLKLGEERSNEEKNILTLKEVLLNSENKLNLSLKENEFSTTEEALKALIPQEIIRSFESEIRDFEDKVKSVKDNIARISKKLNGETIDEEIWENLINRKKENEEKREQITKQIAGDQKTIERMEKDFDEIKVLNKNRRNKEHELALLYDIQELISGNKFVEFAAANQLKYISLEASRRLRDITRGRYALELDSNNEFVMRDDFNGGIRRSADTLSGGETFLTSLCLALALSSNIQLKGNSPLEFFFLDEGFGTLDVELLEVVISSLERLRNDKLCVGIISHVEELKSRVPIKLLVTPATIEGNGTKVAIEYS